MTSRVDQADLDWFIDKLDSVQFLRNVLGFDRTAREHYDSVLKNIGDEEAEREVFKYYYIYEKHRRASIEEIFKSIES